MTIREDVVASAVTFLQDPSVATSPVENKLSFLRSKNLTQEEIDVAFARTGAPAQAQSPVTAPVQQQQQPYYAPYPQQPYGWQPPPPEPPKRDWRDWFIMATVMGGVGYGLYFITKRYIYPLVAPPTPEKLEQDKSTVDEQFERAFATIEQLAKDTETLKVSEKDRTEKLDSLVQDLESFMRDTKSAGRRQEDETERLRDEMKTLKSVIPKSMTSHKEFTDQRLKEISTEVTSLKALISQRMNSSTPAASASSAPSSNHARLTNGNASPAGPATPSWNPTITDGAKENADVKAAGKEENAKPAQASRQDYISSLAGRSSPFGGAGTASIPAWQLAATKNSNAAGSSQDAAGGSS